ncbi:MAG: BMP family ABC transporter substrate-binding protein [Oscillospiraceae bacterium]|nr:BMP family ABC transporter substrate-binding protein [Oscillospiraceae bacterium]
MSRQEAVQQYQEALKKGRKAYREGVLHGQYPYPQVLDTMLNYASSAGQVELGLLEIPARRVVGTKTQGRRDAFASNFMPLMPPDSEFASKWIALCEAHLSDEGIREPVRCFEYLGRFYIQEGNKRVSVLKSYGALSIPAYVTRIVPAWSEEPAIRAYYEFMHAYQLTGLYQVMFSRPGRFAKLQAALERGSEQVWTEEERRGFITVYLDFERAFNKLGGDKLGITVADALLVLLKVKSFAEIKAMSAAELNKALGAVWADVRLSTQDEPVSVSTETQETDAEPNLLRRIVDSVSISKLRLAFVSDYLPEESDWAQAHELGRQYVEATLGDRVTCLTYYGAKNASQVMEEAVRDGAQVIFGMTPSLIGACRAVATKHPDVRVFSCSISMPYADVRTYYCRVYEGKFVTGAIAGALSQSDVIGYVASNPILGVPAAVNAFALGAQLTNPRARVRLAWSCVDARAAEALAASGVDYISKRDVPTPDRMVEPWGLCRVENGVLHPVASPYWHWGKVYEKLVRGVLDGSLDAMSAGNDRAVNYWWGMQSGSVGVLIDNAMDAGTRQLTNLLCRGLTDGSILPFERAVRDQSGTVRSDGTHFFSPEEILKMDWFAENVEGSLPAYDELLPMSRSLVRLQGVYRDSIPPEKEDAIL